MPDNKKTIDADFSGGKRYPFVQPKTAPNFNIDWLRSPRAFEIAKESELKDNPNMSDDEATRKSRERLKARRDEIRATKTFIQPLGKAKAIATERRTIPGLEKGPEISLNPNNLSGGIQSLLIHERDHTKLDMPDSDRELLQRNELQNSQNQDWKARISSPDEIRARSQVVRNALKRDRIADPFTEQITPEHIKQLTKKYGKGKPGINVDDNELDNIQQFLRNTSEESATEILNTVAQADVPKMPWGFV